MVRFLKIKPVIKAASAGLACIVMLSSCADPREKPPSTLRPDAAQKSQQERQAKIDRDKRIRNTQDCYIEERRLNPNKHTTCFYKCPDGKIESENVAPGFYCPTVLNVIKR